MIYRGEKGSPLSADELDGNFKEIIERLKILEEGLEPAEGIGEIRLEGRDLVVSGTYGHHYGRFPLPQSDIAFKGPWRQEALYAKGNVVFHQSTLLQARREHQSETFDEEMWAVVFQTSQPSFPSEVTLKVYPAADMPKGVLGQMILVIEEGTGALMPYVCVGSQWKRVG